MATSDIVIRGAREHNLRNVTVRLPRNKLICMTGVSGSGKSSLAFDTLYAEGQRRYVESLSSYARQFLGQLPKPEVDAVSGLSPSISIQQKTSGRNPRSTVGTITEIYDYLRVLFARVGTAYCERCGEPIRAQTIEQILEHIGRLPEGTRFLILAPRAQQQKGEYRDLFDDLLKQGFLRARVDGKIVQLTENLKLDRHMRHTIEVVVDRLTAGQAGRARLAEAVESALKLSGGTLIVSVDTPDGGPDESETSAKPGRKSNRESKKSAGNGSAPNDTLYSAHYACTQCGINYEPPGPQLFSFNSPLGMCLECNGLGRRHDFIKELLIPDPSLSVARGAINLLGSIRGMGRWRRHIYQGVAAAVEKDAGLPEGAFLATPWNDLPESARRLFLYGMGKRHITFTWRYSGGAWKHGGTFAGVIPELLENYRKTRNPMRRRQLEKYMRFVDCTSCKGSRLNPQAQSVRITSTGVAYQRRKKPLQLNLPQVCALCIGEAAEFFESLALDETGQMIAGEVLKEIRGRLGFLLRCGLDYLTLERTAPTLSGGESQRIRLAGQIGCGLVGVVYILDEPSIGLHSRDNALLLESLCALRNQGNTVIVVEHDEETMRAADHVVDFGPGPGVRGGEIVAQGTLDDLVQQPKSLTGKYLSGQLEIPVPSKRRPIGKKGITVKGARHNNLKKIDVRFPLESFICLTGVSGSGKSSLVNDILWEVLNRDVNQGIGNPGAHDKVLGLEHVDKAIDIDQSPIGRTPRSNPATYVKLFDQIRDLYTKLPESRMRGFKPGRFSFNTAGGRCEACEGHGANRLEMDFLADIWVPCPVCGGHRFNHETLEVRYKGRNIADVLEMDVQEALEHFANHPKIVRLLATLHRVGLDYLKLGQPSPTLSGGEAQRIKLARELGKRSTGRTIYLLDEPTTGLHFADVQKLLEVLHGFVDAGNTVLVVEHNLDVIKTADWIIDLGPDGGDAGGTIVAEGTPEEIAAAKQSHTGRALAGALRAAHARSHTTHATKSRSNSTNGRGGKNGRKPAASGNGQAESAAETRSIIVRGAAQHNLQHIDISIPRDKINVFCGPSGSGKSSLAMDTLYAEGQRRYVESLSAYARQFLGQMPKPRVEHIHGLSPAIAIEQKATGQTPRSTVGTVTEIYDYLRILYARLGTLYCPDCQIPIQTQTTDQVIERIVGCPAGTTLVLGAPQDVPVGQKYENLWKRLQSQGFLRVRVDGHIYRLEEVPDIDRRRKHQVDVVVDRFTVDRKNRSRIADSVETALALGRGVVTAAWVDPAVSEEDWRVDRYSLHYACPQCERSFDDLTPHNFSFNSPLGWCEACQGLGTEQGTNLSALIADRKRTLANGAIAAWPAFNTNATFRAILTGLSETFRIPLDVPFDELDPGRQRMILYGTGDRWFPVTLPVTRASGAVANGNNRRGSRNPAGKGDGITIKVQYKGLFPAIEEASRVSFAYRHKLHDMVGEVPCSGCGGSRLRDEAANVRFQGKMLQELCEQPLFETLAFLKSARLKSAERKVAGDLLTEATSRLTFLVDVGLHYLTLARTLPSLSGGEVQRIRLAGQIGRALTGVLYVLDEPTIGLHPRDNGRLLRALEKLRDLGNTLVLVEHDREVLKAADMLYDFGPGAGRFGGTVVGAGTPAEVEKLDASLTGRYLSGKKAIPIPKIRRMSDGDLNQPTPGGGWLELLGARQNNLRSVDLRIPLGTFTCITGVSGSGKSSLIEETLARAVARRLHRTTETPGPFDDLRGLEQINKIIVVDQQPLGNTPASNPATYTGVFEHIRELYSRLPEAKVRGYGPARFSFNRAGGRCEDCEGNGQKCVEMHFLPDVWVTCETCRGKRYNAETLTVTFRGQSIADVLDMSIGQALELFENIPKIRGSLATLSAIGLDYLTLGQSAPTLSGGEAQRVKLAAELARPQTGKTLYILDEPTTGLHFDDIDKLLKILNSLVEQGNTVVVIEHNLDVLKTADWIVDLGPEAGNAGGWIVAQGTPEDVVAQARAFQKPSSRARQNDNGASRELPFRSYTGEVLEPALAKGRREERAVFDVTSVGSARAGDVDLRQVGRDAKMPWQRDGRRWHTVDRIAHNGRSCRWDGAALEHVIDRLEENEGLAGPNWNHRTVVEVMGVEKQGGWFLHALTGDEWLLGLKFRVKKNTFDQETLRRQLAIKSLDELDELPVYGRSERVRVRNLKGPWQEVTISVHAHDEIDTPAFATFLERACESFLGEIRKARLNPDDLTPWKVLGRKWHLLRKGFPSGKRVYWQPETLERIFALLERTLPQGNVDWSGKQVVSFRPADDADAWATVNTKRREGIDLTLLAPAGTFALGGIAELGNRRSIETHRDGREAIQIRFTRDEQVTAAAFKEFLDEFRKRVLK